MIHRELFEGAGGVDALGLGAAGDNQQVHVRHCIRRREVQPYQREAQAISCGEGGHHSEAVGRPGREVVRETEKGVVLSEGRIMCVGIILCELIKVGISAAEYMPRSTVASLPWMMLYHMSRASHRAQLQEESNRQVLRAPKAEQVPST